MVSSALDSWNRNLATRVLSLLVLCALIELFFLLNSNSNMCIDMSNLPIAFIVFLEYNRTFLHMIDDVGHGLVLIASNCLNVNIKCII
jgi:hypothetical protein